MYSYPRLDAGPIPIDLQSDKGGERETSLVKPEKCVNICRPLPLFDAPPKPATFLCVGKWGPISGPFVESDARLVNQYVSGFFFYGQLATRVPST